MKRELNRAFGAHTLSDQICGSRQSFGAIEQRFAAVERDTKFSQAVQRYVFIDTQRELLKRVVGNKVRLLSPALIGVFVYVAIVAVQVASGSDFDERRSE